MRARLAALPASIGVMLTAVSALLIVQSRPWTSTDERWWLAEGIAGLMVGIGLLVLKRR